ncbi:Major facilitator superfamily domain containing protein [Elaphomyces granulatus]
MAHDEIIHQATELTPEEKVTERKLLRYLDMSIMPLILLVYVMNFIDRNNYSAARLQGLERDLHLTGTEYGTGLSILFVGYILGQVPSNLLLNYIGRPSLYMGFFTIAWGLVSALTSQVRGYGELVACRFILGFVEAPFFAGMLFYLSKWYTKRELGLRMSIFYSGSLLSGAFGNLIGAGILSGLSGKLGMSAWQWLYIVCGAVTCLIGLVIVFVLPDFPENWRLLTPETKDVANRRLAIDAAEVDIDDGDSRSQIRGLELAFTDMRTYILAITYMCLVGTAGFQNFFPTLAVTLGFNNIISLLLVAPPYIFMVIYSMTHNMLSDRIGNRFWFLIYPMPITIIGFTIFMTTNSFIPRYFSLFLMTFVFAMQGTLFSWVASSIPRPPAKRATAYAFMNSLGNSAGIWTPYTYREQDKPYYRPALGVCIGLQILASFMATLLYINLRSSNKRLERLENEDAVFSERDLQRLQKTAEAEGIDIEVARRRQRGFRFLL